MELIFKILVLDIMWVMGFKVITEDGMLLEKVGNWGKKWYDKGYKIMDGLIICPFCLPNLHGILFVWPMAFMLDVVPFEWNWKYLIVHIFVACGGSFICGIIWSLYKHLELKHKYLEHKEQNEFFDLKNRKEQYFKNKKS